LMYGIYLKHDVVDNNALPRMSTRTVTGFIEGPGYV
jgi:hypothetical protein